MTDIAIKSSRSKLQIKWVGKKGFDFIRIGKRPVSFYDIAE